MPISFMFFIPWFAFQVSGRQLVFLWNSFCEFYTQVKSVQHEIACFLKYSIKTVYSRDFSEEFHFKKTNQNRYLGQYLGLVLKGHQASSNRLSSLFFRSQSSSLWLPCVWLAIETHDKPVSLLTFMPGVSAHVPVGLHVTWLRSTPSCHLNKCWQCSQSECSSEVSRTLTQRFKFL